MIQQEIQVEDAGFDIAERLAKIVNQTVENLFGGCGGSHGVPGFSITQEHRDASGLWRPISPFGRKLTKSGRSCPFHLVAAFGLGAIQGEVGFVQEGRAIGFGGTCA